MPPSGPLLTLRPSQGGGSFEPPGGRSTGTHAGAMSSVSQQPHLSGGHRAALEPHRPPWRCPTSPSTTATSRRSRIFPSNVLRGETSPFLGPNGAGKSTTIKMLCTLARPTSGTAVVDGFDAVRQPRAVRRHIGLVFQEQTLDDELTAEENLRFHAVCTAFPTTRLMSGSTKCFAW